jgi:hypothetical protein
VTKNIVVRRTDEQDQILYQHFKRQRGANIGFYRSSNEEHPEQEHLEQEQPEQEHLEREHLEQEHLEQEHLEQEHSE